MADRVISAGIRGQALAETIVVHELRHRPHVARQQTTAAEQFATQYPELGRIHRRTEALRQPFDELIFLIDSDLDRPPKIRVINYMCNYRLARQLAVGCMERRPVGGSSTTSVSVRSAARRVEGRISARRPPARPLGGR